MRKLYSKWWMVIVNRGAGLIDIVWNRNLANEIDSGIKKEFIEYFFNPYWDEIYASGIYEIDDQHVNVAFYEFITSWIPSTVKIGIYWILGKFIL